jgi:hypothetical protein
MQGRRSKWIIAAIAATLLIAGSTAVWAQSPSCTATAPNFSPDFSSSQNCLTENGTPTLSGYPGFYPPAATLTQPPGTPDPAQSAPSGTNIVLRLTSNATFTSGSAWFNAVQPVSGPFTTTFTFQVSGATNFQADGFAFLIQNSAAGTSALDPGNSYDGCSLGFGDAPDGVCTSTTGGIPNSLAVEFDTYQNTDIDDPNGNHVAIESCGTAPNSVEGPPLPGSCQLADNTLAGLLDPRGNPLTLADGYPHIVTITYSGPGSTLLDVFVDGNDLFPGGIVVNLATLLNLNGGNAYVGFTAATGEGNDNQDILNWTYTPQAESTVVSTTTKAIVNFPNASGTNVYDYTAQLTAPYNNPVVKIQPILMTQAACDALVQQTFPTARCFVYANAENSGLNASVMFAVTCPDSLSGVCGSNTQRFFAELGTDFEYSQSANPFFTYPGVFGPFNPFPGWVKGTGPNPLVPCTPAENVPLFQSNQIDSFFIDIVHTTGGSGGGASCWVATYNMPDEALPGIKISSPKINVIGYKQNQPLTASYTCSNPVTSKPESTSPVGPYLTVASCTQDQVPVPSGFSEMNSCTGSGTTTGALTCTGAVDTSILGIHTFLVTSTDTGGNTNIIPVIYEVVPAKK